MILSALQNWPVSLTLLSAYSVEENSCTFEVRGVSERRIFTLILSNLGLIEQRSKFISIYNQPPLIPIISHLAGNHFDGHADFDGVVVHVGQLGGDHGTFVQFDECHSVGRVAVVSGGGFINGRVGIHFTLAAEGIEFFGFIAAVWAYVAWGKIL